MWHNFKHYNEDFAQNMMQKMSKSLTSKGRSLIIGSQIRNWQFRIRIEHLQSESESEL